MQVDDIIGSVIWSAMVLVAFLLLNHYVFKSEISVWFFAFVPMGKEVLKLMWKYGNVLRKRNKKAFVELNFSNFQASDFSWIIVSFGFVAYVRIDLIYYLIPLAVVNLLLLYVVKKKQRYYFGEWDLENLSEENKNIDIFCIISIHFQPNRLKIVYVKDEDDLKDAEEYKIFVIKKGQLASPQSWLALEQIVADFETSLAKLNKKYQKKNTTLDSVYESAS